MVSCLVELKESSSAEDARQWWGEIFGIKNENETASRTYFSYQDICPIKPIQNVNSISLFRWQERALFLKFQIFPGIPGTPIPPLWSSIPRLFVTNYTPPPKQSSSPEIIQLGERSVGKWREMNAIPNVQCFLIKMKHDIFKNYIYKT